METSAGTGYVDYLGTINGLSRLIIEAKRQGHYIGINNSGAQTPVSSPNGLWVEASISTSLQTLGVPFSVVVTADEVEEN